MKFILALTAACFALAPISVLAASECVTEQTPPDKLTTLFPDAPVYDADKIGNSVAWSQPVVIKDGFTESQRLYVLDRNYQKSFVGLTPTEKGVITVWGQKGIKIQFYAVVSGQAPIRADADRAAIKVDGTIYDLSRDTEQGFTFTDELAAALQTTNSPVTIRASYGTTDAETFTIGTKTIQSWQQIRTRLTESCRRK